MNVDDYRIFPLGTNALTIDFGNEISLDLNDKAVSFAQYFEENPFEGLREVVPAYASVTIFYDVPTIKKNFADRFGTAFETVRELTEKALLNSVRKPFINSRLITIPVDFSDACAPDLEFVAARRSLSKSKAIEIFTKETYRVFMLGFMPAFAYLGKVDARIAAPRKASPRLLVPQGSVGIAGSQTGIYPFDSPGGWQLIGKTDFRLFTPHEESPCALAPGDSVRFYAANE